MDATTRAERRRLIRETRPGVARPFAPVACHVSPPVRLRELLQAERAAGADFHGAWERSLTPTLRHAPGGEVDDWRDALEWARPAWRRAYTAAPLAPLEQALAACAPDDGEPDDGEPGLEPSSDGRLATKERDRLVWERFHGVRADVVAMEAPYLGGSARTIERARAAEAVRRGVRVRPIDGEILDTDRTDGVRKVDRAVR